MGDNNGNTPKGKAENFQHGLFADVRVLRLVKRRRAEQGPLGDDPKKPEVYNPIQICMTRSSYAGGQV